MMVYCMYKILNCLSCVKVLKITCKVKNVHQNQLFHQSEYSLAPICDVIFAMTSFSFMSRSSYGLDVTLDDTHE